VPLPEGISEETDICRLSSRWGISVQLALKLKRMARRIPMGLTIFSGARSPEHQDRLREAGRPAATNSTSTHLSCPATGADVRFTLGAANLELQSRAIFGAEAVSAGLRWGGGGRIDPTTGIPIDWNHLDLGPRTT